MFKKIWAKRPHRCGVCDVHLPWFDVKLCAHLVGKGSHPNMRLEEDNIELLCFPHHYMLDHETHKAKSDERFDYIFKKIDELKIISNDKT